MGTKSITKSYGLLIVLSLFLTVPSISIAQRCTGASNCTVCKDCSRCKHCNSGGSCGVCSGSKRRSGTSGESIGFYSKPSTSASTYNNQKVSSRYPDYYLKTLLVDASSLNLRSGPNSYNTILEKLNRGQRLIFLDMNSEWVKVKVLATNSIGYVHYKYVLLID